MSVFQPEAGPSRAIKRPRLAHDAPLSPSAAGPPRTRARRAAPTIAEDVFNASTATATVVPRSARPPAAGALEQRQQNRVDEWVHQRVFIPSPRSKASPARSNKPSLPLPSAPTVGTTSAPLSASASALATDQSYAHLRTPSRRVRDREMSDKDQGGGEGSVLFSDRTPGSRAGTATPKSRGDEMIEALLAAYGPDRNLVRPPGYGEVQDEEDDWIDNIRVEEAAALEREQSAPTGAHGEELGDEDAEGEEEVVGDSMEDGPFYPVDPYFPDEPAAPTESLPHRSTEDLDTPLPLPTPSELVNGTTAPIDESSQMRADARQMQARASDYLPRPYAPAAAIEATQEAMTGEEESDGVYLQPTEVSTTNFEVIGERTRSPTPTPVMAFDFMVGMENGETSAKRQAREACAAGESRRLSDAQHSRQPGPLEPLSEADDEQVHAGPSHPRTARSPIQSVFILNRDGQNMTMDECLDPLRQDTRDWENGMSSDDNEDEEIPPWALDPADPGYKGKGKTKARSGSGSTHRSRATGHEDEDDDRPLAARSYHSGDSDMYEMDYRPVLERTEVKRDIREFVQSLKVLRSKPQYKVVDRLGEGTFSSVYLAKDIYHNRYSNRYWSGKGSVRRPDLIHKKRYDKPVALKKVLATSSPARIENELAILEALRGSRNVSCLITAFREDDQVIIVLPYHQSDDFRHFYRLMDAEHIQSYMRNLMQALADIHAKGIIHRDVKPANFLYDYAAQTGVLVDFGLAERYLPPRKIHCQHSAAGLEHLHGKRVKTADTSTVEQAVYDARKKGQLKPEKIGVPKEDKRPPARANRAGTRGFRAPEVLFKCPDQTFAIDIWSAGVMLLSLLTHKFPIFNSNDDVEALMEIAAIYGRLSMEKCAMLHNRTMITNLPTIDTAPCSIKQLILKLNPHIYTPPFDFPTPDQAKAHIEAMDDGMELCAQLLRLDCTRRFTAKQALQHPFLEEAIAATARVDKWGEQIPEDEQVQGNGVHPMQGKCGHLHFVEGEDVSNFGEGYAKHQAMFGSRVVDMPFGAGIPASKRDLCPEHLHYQQRTLRNPLSKSRPLWFPEGHSTYDSLDEEESGEDGSETLDEEDTDHTQVDQEEDADAEGEDEEKVPEGEQDEMEDSDDQAEQAPQNELLGRQHQASEWPADEDTLIVDPPTPHTAGNGSVHGGHGYAHGLGKPAVPAFLPAAARASAVGRTLKTVNVNTPIPERFANRTR